MDEKLLKEKIKLAETSVSALEDRTLKEKAFGVVLSTLLQQSELAKASTQVAEKPRAGRIKGRSVRKPQKELRQSQLKLDENQLEEFKKFYDKFKPTGSELCVFIIANFMRVQFNKEEFHEGDVKYCYDQLLTLRTVTQPPALNLNHIKRALSWLVSPTRRKLWLEVNNDGIYEVSSRGILKLKDLENGLEANGTKPETK